MQGSTKLPNTSKVRNHIILTSRTLQEEFLFGFAEADLLNIKYNVKSCYAESKRSGEKYTETPTYKRESSSEGENLLSSPFSPTSKLKTVKTTVTVRKNHLSSATNLNVRGTLKYIVFVK